MLRLTHGDRTALQAPAGLEPFVPARFIDVVAGHVLHNRLFPDMAPLILAIIGPPGTGKSWQVREVARRLSWGAVELSASTLAGDREGVVTKRLHDMYRRAADAHIDHSETLLLIDDFDLSLASIRTNVETSQHSQLLVSALMELCDRPASVRMLFPERVAIVLTTNSLDAVYGPLVRYGRMHIFHWAPTPTELAAILDRMYAEIPSTHRQAILGKFSSESLVFFKELKSEVLKSLVLARLHADPTKSTEIDPCAIKAEFARTPLDLFETIGQRIASDRATLNYLGK